jgi:hypothetical protein
MRATVVPEAKRKRRVIKVGLECSCGHRIWDLRVQGVKAWAQGLRFTVDAASVSVEFKALGPQGSGSRFQGLGFRVKDLRRKYPGRGYEG